MIEVYTKKGCSFCDDIKNWLVLEKIGYKEKPIENETFLNELVEKQIHSIPHTVIHENKEVTGFDENVKKIILEANTY